MTSLPPRRRRHLPALALLTAILVPGLTQLPALADDGDQPVTPGKVAPLGTDGLADVGGPVAGLAKVDLRGSTTPTATQKQAAAALGVVDLRWNRFGTPASLLPADGVLARATSSDPVTAARSWLGSVRTVFGLTEEQVAGMDAIAQPLVGTDSYAVFMRQTFDGLLPAVGSAITVGVADGKIVYASSSITKTTGEVPEAELTPLEGWLKAAGDVGLDLAGDVIDALKVVDRDGWTRITVPGLLQEQQVRLRALALADGSVRPVLEANVVDVQGGNASAYTVLVDAVDGSILSREDKVLESNDAFPFTGAFTATGCGPRHAFELTDGNTKSITVVASALNVANDIVVNLYNPQNQVIASMDLGTSPEVLTYGAPSIPAGTYKAEVCPFDAPTVPNLPPYNYAMQVTTSDTGSPGGVNLDRNPRWRFFAANPTLDSPKQTPKNSVVACWKKAAGCTISTGPLVNVAAPGPWDTLPALGVPTLSTNGNNAVTHEAWASPLTPGGLFQAPVSPTGQYTTKFTDAWNNSRCNPAELIPGGNDILFSVQNLFASHNRMHDYAYYLGFTEQNYNLQADNMGRGGTGGDPEVGNAQAGALTGGQPSFLGRDNANQIALQDGIPGITNQYLFQPLAGAFYAPCTDGGLDMGIVGHEYTHAISNRMVGGPDEGLSSEQGGAMGESWSDLVAAEYQFSHGYKNGGNIWAVGVYATGNKQVAIRDYAINHNPLNYSNYGFDSTGPEVHADGEIWNGTQWEVRQALVDKYQKRFDYANKKLQLKCAKAGASNGTFPATKCPGNRRWVQLLFDSFLLQQGATSMLDARDAMIAADRMRFKGADVQVLWDAFARRGMGVSASVKDGEDHDPKPSFRSTGKKNVKVTFKTSAPGAIYVGDYEARVTPIADTVKKTKLKSSSSFTPGTYDMLYVGPTHGFMRFTMTVARGKKTQIVKVRTSKNLAAKKSGAKILRADKGSTNTGFLIDGTEEFSWRDASAQNVDKHHPYVVVDLAGGVHKIRTVSVSGMLRPAFGNLNGASDQDAGSRFTAIRRFAISACLKNCGSPKAKWKKVFVSAKDAFPSTRPRPVAPTLNMRAFRIPATRAAALKLTVLENQCTGFSGYAGELDADPINDTDCKTASDRGQVVHVAELQAFTTAFPSWKSSYGLVDSQRSFR